MRKKTIYLLVIAMTIMFPTSVKAACSTTELARLKKMAANITSDYTYQQSENHVSFVINIRNVRPEIYIYDFIKRASYYNDATTWNNESGKTMTYMVRARGGACAEQTLYTFYINLPQYNRFYTKPICDNAREYNLCDKWYNNNDTSEKVFTEKVQTFIDKRNRTIEEEEQKEEMTWQEALFLFVEKYYLYILIPLVVVPGAALLILKRKQASKYS